MKKADQKRLAESLDKALAPPKQKPKQNLDALLDEYDEQQPSASTSISSASSTSRTSSTTIATMQAAPERDFQRVPNSVTRQAMPEGLFRGKSKQVWDYLWSVSRGAVVPTRTVRRSRREIKTGAGLGSMVTVDAAIEHLQRVALIQIKPSVGSLKGNEYEVFTPEESSTSTSSTSSTTSLTQNLVHLDVLDSGISSTTQVVENKTTLVVPKTSFKTIEENDDDEAFAGFARAMRDAARALTGREPTRAEGEQWGELAEVLIAELKMAAARTTVSSVPSFLAEHLRRRLWKIDKKQARAEGRELPDEPAVDALAEGERSRNCPDCRGSGWWYPNGPERGVAKCKHANAQPETTDDAESAGV